MTHGDRVEGSSLKCATVLARIYLIFTLLLADDKPVDNDCKAQQTQTHTQSVTLISQLARIDLCNKIGGQRVGRSDEC